MERRDFLKTTAAGIALGISSRGVGAVDPQFGQQEINRYSGIIKRDNQTVMDLFKNFYVILDNGSREKIRILWMAEEVMEEEGYQLMPDPNAKESPSAVGTIECLELIDIEGPRKFKIGYKVVFWSILQDHRNQLMEQCLVMHNDIPISTIGMDKIRLNPNFGRRIIQKAKVHFTHQVEESE